MQRHSQHWQAAETSSTEASGVRGSTKSRHTANESRLLVAQPRSNHIASHLKH